MSWHFSQALVVASSAGTCSDGDASAPSSTTTTHAAFSWQDRTTGASRRSRYGMTCEPLTDARGEVVLTWCLAASLAKTSAPPAKAQASAEPDPGCGPKWRGLSVRFSRDTSGWRTAHSLFGEDLAWSSLTLPRWGSLHDGELWERTTQEPRTSGTGSGCWATPTANQQQAASIPAALNEAKRLHPRGQWSLVTQVVADHVHGNKMWPTPTASMMPCEGTQRLLRKKWLAGELTLEEASAIGGRDVREAQGKVPKWPTPTADDANNVTRTSGQFKSLTRAVMLPTPTVNDSKNNGAASQLERQSPNLNAVVGGALNPTWVEWLMGWPLGWTDCGASATDRFREWCNAHGRNFND